MNCLTGCAFNKPQRQSPHQDCEMPDQADGQEAHSFLHCEHKRNQLPKYQRACRLEALLMLFLGKIVPWASDVVALLVPRTVHACDHGLVQIDACQDVRKGSLAFCAMQACR